MLKIAVMNNSGNVGKTTICELLLQPRIQDSEILSIETINGDKEGYRASDFMEITRKIISSDNCIIDVGASNIEVFSKRMEDYPDTKEYIDYFIIPVTPTHKQQVDSMKTINNLFLSDIEHKKIRILFNRCSENKALENEFAYVVNSAEFNELKISLPDYPYIPESEVFYHLANGNKKFLSVLADSRDFRALILETVDPLERAILAEERAIKGLAMKFNKYLDAAFQKLNLLEGDL